MDIEYDYVIDQIDLMILILAIDINYKLRGFKKLTQVDTLVTWLDH